MGELLFREAHGRCLNPYISPISCLYLAHIGPMSRLYLAHISPKQDYGRWTYYHDEGRAMHELFMLLLHEQIFDGSIPDVIFAPLHANPNPNP